MITEENAIKRSKTRKNKENIHLNKIQNDRGVHPLSKSGMDLTKLILKKKSRQKLKEALNFTSNGLFKRFSIQIENETQGRSNLIERGMGLNALRKKMSLNNKKKNDMKKNRNRKAKFEQNLKKNNKNMNKGLKSHLRQIKRKEKTLSSNNHSRSSIFKNNESKNDENCKMNQLPISRSNKVKSHFDVLKRKKSFKKARLGENKKSSENNGLNRPPLLPKQSNFMSHTGIRRIRVNGLIKRKQSLNKGNIKGDQNYLSKPNSPKGQSSFQMKPRYFKTLNKESGGESCFIPAPKICRPEKSHTKRLLRIKEEGDKRKPSRKDNLKKILAKKIAENYLRIKIQFSICLKRDLEKFWQINLIKIYLKLMGNLQ